MMLRKKSSPWMRTKALYLIPVAVVALSAFATPKLIATADKAIAPAKPVAPATLVASTDKGNEILAHKEISSEKNAVTAVRPDTVKTAKADNDEVYSVSEQMPEFPGGMQNLMSYLAQSMKYPAVAQANGVQGRALVQFIVEKDGSINDVHLLTFLEQKTEKPSSQTDDVKSNAEEEQKKAEGIKAGKEALIAEALRVVSAMEKWTPGKQDGKTVRVKYVLPISFKLK